PEYAPAWARLGHLYRVTGKFRGEAATMSRAEAALNRALELNPDLSVADRVYAQIEVDYGRSQDAMVRLLRRATSRSSDAELFAGLVHACRYCGLLRASLAAHERARRLDPRVRTSVAYTAFLIGDYPRAAAEAAGFAGCGGLALVMSGDADAIRRMREEAQMLRVANMTSFARLWDELIALLEGTGDVAQLEAAVESVIAGGLRDPEGLYGLATPLAHFGRCDRAVEILADVVERGYFPYPAFARDPWLDPLRERRDFLEILPARNIVISKPARRSSTQAAKRCSAPAARLRADGAGRVRTHEVAGFFKRIVTRRFGQPVRLVPMISSESSPAAPLKAPLPPTIAIGPDSGCAPSATIAEPSARR